MKRIVRSGADGYVLADSMEELARKIVPRSDQLSEWDAPVEPRELNASLTIDDRVAAFLRESDLYAARLREKGD